MKPSSRNWKRLLWTIAGQLLMGLALYLVAVRLVAGGQQLASNLYQMRPASLVGALLLNLVMLLLMSLGWTCALRAVGVPISLRSGFVIYYRVSILRYLPGSIWNFPGRAYLCQQQGISLSAFAAGTFFELFFLLASAGALTGWGLARYTDNPAMLALSAAAVAAMLLVIAWPYRWLPANLTNRLALSPVRRHILMSMILIYMMVWVSSGGAVTLLLLALPGVHSIDPLLVIPASTAAWVGGFLSPSPVGMGVRELGLSVMLGPSLSTAAIVVSLAQRVMELVLEGLLWLVARVHHI